MHPQSPVPFDPELELFHRRRHAFVLVIALVPDLGGLRRLHPLELRARDRVSCVSQNADPGNNNHKVNSKAAGSKVRTRWRGSRLWLVCQTPAVATVMMQLPLLPSKTPWTP